MPRPRRLFRNGAHVRGLGEVAAAPPRERELRTVLAIRPFRMLWISLSLSSLGDWLGFLATTSLAYQLTTSYSHQLYAVAGVIFVRLLPAVVIGPVAGAFADRVNRRTTMVITDLLRFLLFLSIPLHLTLWWLFVATFLIECNSLFWIPAKEASIPNLVPRERLETANQLSLVTTYGFGAVAAALFTALSFVNRVLAHNFHWFRTNPINLALYIDALTFLVSAITIINLREISGARPSSDPEKAHGEQVGLWQSITEGIRFLAQHPWLKGLILGISGATGAGAAVIGLSQAFAVDLKGGEAAYGTLFGTVFVGLAAGMFLGPRVIGSLSRRRVVGLGIIASGITLSIDAVLPNLALAILATAGMGFWAGLVWVVSLTLVGSEVSDELRGRTFAFIYNLMRLVLLAMVVAAPASAGLIGQHVVVVSDARIRLDGVTITLFAAGLLSVLLGVISYRLMDDRPDVPLRADLYAVVRRHKPQLGRGTEAGLFIAFEGGEGAGKSTQVQLLAEDLRASGYEVIVTFEPGATAIGARLRQVLLDRQSAELSPVAEALLYAADRAQHVSEVVRPALERGAVVITDRYIDSSLAYQGAGRALPEGEVRRLSTWASAALLPDLTVVLDVAPEVGLRRRGGPSDRLEDESVAFHRRVRAMFLQLAAHGRDRYLVLDATGEADQIQIAVRQRLAVLLSKVTSTAATSAKRRSRARDAAGAPK
ncbi:MAG TPA: dTMP kinase [Mycobacteriales bacterium]|nr:dTMP kinase [Mycobacteriales bacterium]